jgi:hypothetical protein
MGAPKLIYKDIEKFIPYYYGKVRKSNPTLYPIYSTKELVDRYYTDSKFKNLIDLQDSLRKKKYSQQQASNSSGWTTTYINNNLYIMSDGEILKGHTSVYYYQIKNKLTHVVSTIKVDSEKYTEYLVKYKDVRTQRQEEWDLKKNTPEQAQRIRSLAGNKTAQQTLYVMSDNHICKTKNTANKYIRNFKTEIIKRLTINDSDYQELYELYDLQEQKTKDLRKRYGRRSCILYVLEDGTIHSVTLNNMKVDFDISKTVYTIRCDEEGYDSLREEYTIQTRQHVLDNRKKEAKDKANKIINKLNKTIFTLTELKALLIKLGMKESYSKSCLKFSDVELVQKAKSRHTHTIYKIITK